MPSNETKHLNCKYECTMVEILNVQDNPAPQKKNTERVEMPLESINYTNHAEIC